MLETYLKFRVNCQKRREGWKYSCFEGLLLDLGQSMKPRSIDRSVLGDSAISMQHALAMLDPSEVHYCEGLMWLKDLSEPIVHSWNCDRLGYVIDSTVRELNVEYYGVVFETDWLLRTLIGRNRGYNYPAIMGDLTDEFSYLQHGLPEDALFRTTKYVEN